uniref:Elongation factor Tu n=1 Tax=Lygus hesperus TaxID=30085 RepID=A0A0A9Z822_LYGHE
MIMIGRTMIFFAVLCCFLLMIEKTYSKPGPAPQNSQSNQGLMWQNQTQNIPPNQVPGDARQRIPDGMQSPDGGFRRPHHHRRHDGPPRMPIPQQGRPGTEMSNQIQNGAVNNTQDIEVVSNLNQLGSSDTTTTTTTSTQS